MPKRGYSYDLPMFKATFEYFCNKCGQLRLCIDDASRSTCGSCGSKDIIKGEIGELDKEKLKKSFEEKKIPSIEKPTPPKDRFVKEGVQAKQSKKSFKIKGKGPEFCPSCGIRYGYAMGTGDCGCDDKENR